MQKLEDFLDNIETLPFDDNSAAVAGKIRVQLDKYGTPIGPYDLLIAASALANNCILVTHNIREFSRITDLKI